MLIIWRQYEKRDWGSGTRTWREGYPEHRRYGRHTLGPSEYTLRRLSNRRAKKEIFR